MSCVKTMVKYLLPYDVYKYASYVMHSQLKLVDKKLKYSQNIVKTKSWIIITIMKLQKLKCGDNAPN